MHDEKEMLIRLDRARNTAEEIEQLCNKSARLTARAEELLANLRYEHPIDARTECWRQR